MPAFVLFSVATEFLSSSSLFFFFNDTATTEIYTLSLHDALPISAAALALAEESAAANRLPAKFVRCDVFEELERLAQAGETFDVVVADPPPFVRARKDLEPGAKAYRKLARLAARVTAKSGFLLLASCSHNISTERFGLECATGILRAERHSALIRVAGAGPDHPIHPMLPEGAYLKALVFALD